MITTKGEKKDDFLFPSKQAKKRKVGARIFMDDSDDDEDELEHINADKLNY